MFKTEELLKNSVVAKYATTAADGKIYNVEYYNLDAILSVGYRVNSKQGTKFRIWATSILRDFLNQGDITLNFSLIL
ncbi:RhuM family protein [Cellulophaga sp. Asnod2-G02]|uniref:RhuM family protein n=1 Tax=Cellulophaga sp. Asnod2-G02 TaxID=3160572 RepID=UPI00386CCF1C